MQKLEKGDQVVCFKKEYVNDHTYEVAELEGLYPSEIFTEGIAIIKYPDKTKFKVPADQIKKYNPGPEFDTITITRGDYRRIIRQEIDRVQYFIASPVVEKIEAILFGEPSDPTF